VRKLIVISAPSGAGKTSIVHYLLKNMPSLSFSVSACSRKKRANEIEGKDYYFLDTEGFKAKIKKGDFLEWEEVYKDQFYGTLKSEIERISNQGKTPIFDVDVVGGLNIKNKYPEECLAIFIMPPSISALKKRLSDRGSESEKSLEMRINIAEQEILRNNEFDRVILNNDFNAACEETRKLIIKFINS
tara:strand:+ start:1579 stop:2142 length:564 start_codon:yes stop_codon:yes gene_type:complete